MTDMNQGLGEACSLLISTAFVREKNPLWSYVLEMFFIVLRINFHIYSKVKDYMIRKKKKKT
jgi:hypothetical protein